MQNKLALLEHKLSAYHNVAIAFSGGVDSTFLLLCAKRVLGSAALAVTVTGPNFAPDEIEYAKEFCKKHEIPQLMIRMEDELFQSFAHNPQDRCYICKHGIFSDMRENLMDIPIFDGTNADDAKDYRPGRLALKELGILSPLEEIGFTKKEIRLALKAMNVEIWDKPAYACLASRIPYGETITLEKLTAIYQIEHALKELGFTQVRLRHHGEIARIEVLPEDREKFCNAEIMDKVNKLVKDAGSTYACLDLGGYIMGNLNGEII
ncbi:MAG: ATP-dependent sacrificial sulfur transferase LarE [Anaerovoracaceae bacterium]